MNYYYFIILQIPLFYSIFKYLYHNIWNINLIGNVITENYHIINYHVLNTSIWQLILLIQIFTGSKKLYLIHKINGYISILLFPINILYCVKILLNSKYLVSGKSETIKQYYITFIYLIGLIILLSYYFVMTIYSIILNKIDNHKTYSKKLINLSIHPLILRNISLFFYYIFNNDTNWSISMSLFPTLILSFYFF